MTSSGSRVRMRWVNSLASGSPGTTAAQRFRNREDSAREFGRNLALRDPSSGPSQSKHFFERMGGAWDTKSKWAAEAGAEVRIRSAAVDALAAPSASIKGMYPGMDDEVCR